MDMKKLMKQAQKAQAELNRVQEEIKTLEFDASVGGGAVKATVNGNMELVNLTISPDAVDPEDVEMLQDMICSAVNEALRGMNELSSQRLSAVTGGMGIPGF